MERKSHFPTISSALGDQLLQLSQNSPNLALRDPNPEKAIHVRETRELVTVEELPWGHPLSLELDGHACYFITVLSYV